jgi:murein DD-endopeptidase MepM/ murein hydrolase activator NlpD
MGILDSILGAFGFATTSAGRYLVEEGVFVRGLDMNRRTSDGRVTPHWGVDIGAPEGTPAYAFRPGTVILSRPVRGYGNVVMIRHDDGRTSALYAHLHDSLVQEGQHVVAQELIAHTGTTSVGQQVRFDANGVPTSSGEMSGGAVGPRVGPHLHWELHPVPIPNMAPNFRRLDPVAALRAERPTAVALVGRARRMTGDMAVA